MNFIEKIIRAVAKAIRTKEGAETLTSQSFPLEHSALESSAFCYKFVLR